MRISYWSSDLCSSDLRQTQRGPVVLTVDKAAEAILQVIITNGIRLSDQDDCLVRQLVPPVDRAHEGIDHVLTVDHRLPGISIAGIKMALEIEIGRAHV